MLRPGVAGCAELTGGKAVASRLRQRKTALIAFMQRWDRRQVEETAEDKTDIDFSSVGERDKAEPFRRSRHHESPAW